MMSTPTVAQLVTAIREQLATVISPALEDESHRKLLALVDHLLQTVSVRAEHEIDWMVAHTNDVVGLAQQFVDGGAAPATVDAALQRYRDGQQPSLATSAVTANYALAAETLSAILEFTANDDGPIARTARELLDRDVHRGVEVVGDFKLVPP